MSRKTAKELLDEAFSVHRDKRSEEYKEGVLAVLRYRLGEKAYVSGGYAPGTAGNDAFSAGCEEGHDIWRRYLENNSNN